jgi:fibronectin-binding autotransporter adhesin
MKYTKFAIPIAASIAILILIGSQTFTECRGDDSDALGGTLTMNADAPICPQIDASFIGTIAINAGAIVNDSSSGTLTLNSTGALSGATLDLSGCSNLTKSGAGTLTLSGANTYTGATTVSGGMLQIGNSAALGASEIANGGTLQFNSGSLNLNGNIIGAGNIVPVSGLSGTGTNAAIINNVTLTGNTTIGGAGRWDIRGGSLTGLTTINPGTLQINNDLAISGIPVTLGSSGAIINTSGILQINNPGIVSGGTLTFSGSGGLIKSGTGTICLSGNTTWAGSPIISSGTWQINNSSLNASLGTLNIGNISLYPPNVTLIGAAATLNNSALTINQMGPLQLNNNVTLSGIPLVINGAGTLTKSGAGTLTLINNSYTGSTVFNNGTLQLGGLINPGALTIGSGALTISSGIHTLQGISGSGALTIAPGTDTLVASSVKTETLTIGAGATLTISALPGGPIGGGSLVTVNSLHPIPEPSVMVLLSIAALGFSAYSLGMGRKSI